MRPAVLASAPQRSPRVLILGLAWPPETFLQRVIRGLLAEGWRVAVAASRRPDASWSVVGFEGIAAPSWEGFAGRRILRLARALVAALGRSPRQTLTLCRAVGRIESWPGRLRMLNRVLPAAGRDADVVYFPWNTSLTEYAPVLALSRPVVVSCRGSQVHAAPYDPRRPGLADELRRGFDRAQRVHCVSEATLSQAERFGLDRRKATVIRPAVDPMIFRPSTSRADGPLVRIITTCALRWAKGLTTALLALRRLKDEGQRVRLTIIGDGPERQALLFTIGDLELGDSVVLAGRLRPEEVLTHLQEADIFLLTSVTEGISNAALEAMSCGLPVVTTDCGGMGEAVRDGVDGYVVPVRDPKAAANALRRLIDDPETRRRMGRAARERIERDFDARAQAAAFSRLLQEAMACEVA